MTFTTSRDPNGTVTVSPRNEADQTATIVLCHGLGDSAQGWEDVAEVRCWLNVLNESVKTLPLELRLMSFRRI